MEPNFWHERWETNQIGFHEEVVNPLIVSHCEALGLAAHNRVFVPLCGKTLVMPWLLNQGYRVVGVELDEKAIVQFFSELGVEPAVVDFGDIKRFSTTGIEVFVGDFFDLTSEVVGEIDAIIDRAALVALPQEMRNRYTRHLIEVTASASQLLLTFAYDESEMEGPPFVVTDVEVHRQYRVAYDIHELESIEVPGGLKGNDATETAWLLKARR